MAFFNFRFPGHKAGSAPAPAPAESVEGMRRRARHRLIGAAVLVLVAVIGFPLVFDTQPRPVAVDVPIEIPDRAKAKPLVMPSAEPQGAASLAVKPQASSAAPPPVAAASRVAPGASLDAKEEIVTGNSVPKQDLPSVKQSSSAINDEAVREPVAPPRSETKPETKVEAKAPAARPADDGNRARALLEGKDSPKPAAADGQRFIVQVGAFSDPVKARETRLKVERAGLTTYTQVVDTPEGKRTRVRVGPFASRAEADKAAARIQGLDLPAAILAL